MLSKKHLEDRCLVWGGHKTCRYLVYDQQTGKNLCCKQVQGLKDEIDKRIEDYTTKAKKNNQDLSMLGRPVGDNCDGYLYLKNTLQGYDVPGSA
jgi:hypothetical protein